MMSLSFCIIFLPTLGRSLRFSIDHSSQNYGGGVDVESFCFQVIYRHAENGSLAGNLTGFFLWFKSYLLISGD